MANNEKIFVFEDDFRESGLKVYSSLDGINWTLENVDAFPKRRGGTAIVFKNTLYYMGGATEGSGISNEIWESTNGRDWSKTASATPNKFNPGENFPAKFGHAAVVHDNAVWVTGGDAIKGNTAQGKDIWVSKNMRNWIKYNGTSPFNPHVRATLLSYKDRILLMGGFSISKSGVSVKSKTIWSIKPKSTPWMPEITRK